MIMNDERFGLFVVTHHLGIRFFFRLNFSPDLFCFFPRMYEKIDEITRDYIRIVDGNMYRFIKQYNKYGRFIIILVKLINDCNGNCLENKTNK